jgi:disulfide bond formation protein DsbB
MAGPATETLLPRLLQPVPAALVCLVVGGATIAGAWYSELGLGFVPCKLCLWQRWPYYLGLPVVMLGLVFGLGGRPGAARLALGLFALMFVISAGLGAYHAGVEWGLFTGPADCGGRVPAAPASMGDFLKSLQTARAVNCTEAPMRIVGLSFAGWNALISAGLAVFAWRAAAGPDRRA